MDLDKYIKQKVKELKMFDEYKERDDFTIVKRIFETELLRVINKESKEKK